MRSSSADNSNQYAQHTISRLCFSLLFTSGGGNVGGEPYKHSSVLSINQRRIFILHTQTWVSQTWRWHGLSRHISAQLWLSCHNKHLPRHISLPGWSYGPHRWVGRQGIQAVLSQRSSHGSILPPANHPRLRGLVHVLILCIQPCNFFYECLIPFKSFEIPKTAQGGMFYMGFVGILHL